MRVGSGNAYHSRLSRLCLRAALTVELVEDCSEELFTVPDGILKGDLPALDIRLIHVDRNGGAIADLLRQQHPCGRKNGTEG